MIKKAVLVIGALALMFSAFRGSQMYAQEIEHLYITNQAGSSVSLYNMDPITGSLVFVTTFATPYFPFGLSFNPSGTYAYLTSGGPSPAITTYAVDATTGSLSQVASIDLSAGALPVAKVDPTGNYLVVIDIMHHSVLTYHINSDGSLSFAGSVTPPDVMDQMVFSPAAGVIDASGTTSVLTQLAFSSSSGEVSKTGSMTLSAFPNPAPASHAPVEKNIALHPSGKYLYVIDTLAGTITGFSVNPTSGALTQLPGAPYSLSGFAPLGFAFASSGSFLYLSNWNVGAITGVKVNLDGSLTAIPTTPIITPFVTQTRRGGHVVLVTDTSGKFLYAVSADTSQITGYSVGPTSGALTQVSGLLLSTGEGPSDAVFAP